MQPADSKTTKSKSSGGKKGFWLAELVIKKEILQYSELLWVPSNIYFNPVTNPKERSYFWILIV